MNIIYIKESDNELTLIRGMKSGSIFECNGIRSIKTNIPIQDSDFFVCIDMQTGSQINFDPWEEGTKINESIIKGMS